jgi:hypothetical protein
MEFSARPLDVCFTKNGNRKTVAKSVSAKSGSERTYSITSSAARIRHTLSADGRDECQV